MSPTVCQSRCVVALTLFLSLPLWPAQQEGSLTIDVDDGANQFSYLGREFAKQIRITVRDELGRPVPNANVVFYTTPEAGGPGAVSPGSMQVSTKTDKDGKATSGTLFANRRDGEYQIRAVAEFYGKRGVAPITEHNLKLPLTRRKSTWITVASAAAGVLIPILVIRAQQQPTATISTVTPTGPVTHP